MHNVRRGGGGERERGGRDRERNSCLTLFSGRYLSLASTVYLSKDCSLL
jgi:hypothetical protein